MNPIERLRSRYNQLGLSLAKPSKLGPRLPVLLCLSEFLSKIGTHLLFSSDIMSSWRKIATRLLDAGSYFA